MKHLTLMIFLLIFCNANCDVIYHSSDKQCSDQLPNFCTCNQIQISCDCNDDTAVIGPDFTNQKVITIKNCQQLLIRPRSFINIDLLKIILHNVKDLRFMKESFEAGPFKETGINLTITNSTSHEIPAHVFTTPEFGNHTNQAGNPQKALKPNLIFEVHNSVLHKIDTGAFGNFILKKFSIINSTLGLFASEAINNPITKTLQIINTTITRLQRNAIVLQGSSADEGLLFRYNEFKGDIPNFLSGRIRGDFYVSNNVFPFLKHSPWNLTVDGDIYLRNNTFMNIPKNGLHFKVNNRINIVDNDIKHLQSYAFQWILPSGERSFLFLEGNIIHQHDPMSLCLNEEFDVNAVQIKHILFHEKCLCNITGHIGAALGLPDLTTEDLYKDGIHQEWLRNGECLQMAQTKSRVPLEQFLVDACLKQKSMTMVLLLVFSIILITITVCVIVAWRRIKQKTTITPSASDYQSFTEPLPPSRGPSPWALVQPEPRTYQETEIHILFDKAQEIDVSEGGHSPNSGEMNETKPKINEGGETTKEREILRVKASPAIRQSCPPLKLSN